MTEVIVPQGVTAVEYPQVAIAYSGIEVGNVAPPYGEAADVQASQAKLLAPLNPDRYVAQVPQLSADFLDLSLIPDEELEARYPTDGLFINRPNIALGVHPADCIAMAIYSEDDGVLGVIHAGRQGVDGGIHELAVSHMIDAHGVALDAIRAYFGPSIRQESYFYPEISPAQLADPKWNKFIDRRNGNYHIDLVGRVVKDLAELDIDPANIAMSPVDTGADPAYFSHSRAKRTGETVGRNGFAAVLKED
jgi:copper oxidase (laccase) domain-containing protein